MNYQLIMTYKMEKRLFCILSFYQENGKKQDNIYDTKICNKSKFKYFSKKLLKSLYFFLYYVII